MIIQVQIRENNLIPFIIWVGRSSKGGIYYPILVAT